MFVSFSHERILIGLKNAIIKKIHFLSTDWAAKTWGPSTGAWRQTTTWLLRPSLPFALTSCVSVFKSEALFKWLCPSLSLYLYMSYFRLYQQLSPSQKFLKISLSKHKAINYCSFIISVILISCNVRICCEHKWLPVMVETCWCIECFKTHVCHLCFVLFFFFRRYISIP